MVTSRFACVRSSTISEAWSWVLMLALDEEHVVRPGGPDRAGLGELDDLEPAGERQQLVLEVEERELAPVAGRHLDDADAETRPGGDGGHQMPSLPKTPPSWASEKTGPSLQTKRPPVWQWPHSPMPHSMCRSSVTKIRSGGSPRSTRAFDRRLHHPLGTAHEGEGPRAVPGGAVEQLRDDAHGTGPTGTRAVDDDLDIDVPARGPAADLLAVEVVGRGAGAVVEPDVVELVALGEQPVDERPQRREADAAGGDDHVVAHRPLDRPRRPERTPDADLVARRPCR